MWPARRKALAACVCLWGLLGPLSAWASPTSPPSTLAPGSVVLLAEDYDALVEAGVQAQNELRNSSETIKNLSDVVTSNSRTIESNSTVIADNSTVIRNNSETITAQSKALENSSAVIAAQARTSKLLSLACAVLGTAALLEGLALVFK